MKPGKQRRHGAQVAVAPALAALQPACAMLEPAAARQATAEPPRQRGVIAAASDEHTRSFLDVVKDLPLIPAATPGEKLGYVRGRSGKYTDQVTFCLTGLR